MAATIRREIGPERPNFRQEVMDQGLTFVDTTLPDGRVVSYWREAPHMVISPEHVDLLSEASTELFQMLIAAGDYIIENDLFAKLGIPPWAIPAIKRSWEASDLKSDAGWKASAPSVYGRYDLRFDGEDVKLLEFNADTPTSLLESIIQWFWKEANHPEADQWNEIHERLVDAWTRNIEHHEECTGKKVELIHFAYSASQDADENTIREDAANVACLAAAAEAAGYRVKVIRWEDIAAVYDGEVVFAEGYPPEGIRHAHFMDEDNERIEFLLKLFPWEWIVDTDAGRSMLLASEREDGLTVVEPAYKMLWSNKGILAILWETFKETPYAELLLETYFEGEEPEGFRDGGYARKPKLGREGADVELYLPGGKLLAECKRGDYTETGYVVQRLMVLPSADGEHNYVTGVWMVDGEPAGLDFREGPPITNDGSYFVCHTIETAA